MEGGRGSVGNAATGRAIGCVPGGAGVESGAGT